MKNAVTWTPASSLTPFMEGSLAPAGFRPIQDLGSMAVNWDKFSAEAGTRAVLPAIPLGTFADFIWKDMEDWSDLD